MLVWHKKYLNPIIPKNKFKVIIEKIKNKINDKTHQQIENIDKYYYDKINEINELTNNKEKISQLLKLNSLELLKEEYKLVKLFSKYSLQENSYDKLFLLKILKLLLVMSEELRKRLKQPEINHKVRNDKLILRCSYKFCNFKSECNYHYFNKKCNSDHFVHNMISADIKNLINYFNLNIKKPNNKEVIKSINTLLFVISHMENELSNSCRYQNKDKWEQYHL